MTESDEQVSIHGKAKPGRQLLLGFFAGVLLAFTLRFIQVFHVHADVGKSPIDFIVFSAKGGVGGLWCSRLLKAQVPRFLGILVVVFGIILVVPCIESPMGDVPLGTAYLHDHGRKVVYLVNHVCVSILISVAVDLLWSARYRRGDRN